MYFINFVISFICVLSLCECEEIQDPCWGPKNNTSIRPFRIVFDDYMIQDLRARLLSYRPSRPTFKGVGFEYGFNSRELPSWINYWANIYPFKEREEYLNQFPQYKTTIQGLDIHFIRVVPMVPAEVEIIPLLMLHGWAESVRVYYDVIPRLTASRRDFAVEVIVPSLPGFGYSDAADRPGLNAVEMAIVFRNLMHRLGHRRFYVVGGDWGGVIGSHISTLFQKEVLGYYTNYAVTITTEGLFLTLLGSVLPSLVVEPALAERMYPLADKLLGALRETGYMHLQATKPESIGIGLSDSPAGLLAYFFQLMSTGTEPDNVSKTDGGLDRYPRSTLIDNLMMYWTSNTVTTSMRIYTETMNKFLEFDISGTPTEVPTCVIQARYEIAYQSPIILKKKFPNLLHATVLPDGGHFLALEKPEVFSDDVLMALWRFRAWHRKRT